MASQTQQDRTFQIIMEAFVETGRAPDVEQIAEGLGVGVEEGRKALRKLIKPMGFPGWLQPGTDEIGSFPPFSNVPNQHAITIDGKQNWYGQ